MWASPEHHGGGNLDVQHQMSKLNLSPRTVVASTPPNNVKPPLIIQIPSSNNTATMPASPETPNSTPSTKKRHRRSTFVLIGS